MWLFLNLYTLFFFFFFFRWAQGYDGGQASYINRDTICFRCGNHVKFLNEDGHVNIFPSGGSGLGAIAVHPVNKVFAVADIDQHPKINIYEYPTFQHIKELTGKCRKYV